jgi:hypothetical protein
LFVDEADMGPNLTWSDGATYPDNCFLRHQGVGYRATAAHTADAASEPGVGANWTDFWELRTETNVTDVLDNFATEYPEWASQGFEIAGFVWWQGHKDGGQDGTGSANAYATRYEQNLVRLIDELRDYYENRYPLSTVTDAPFVVASVGFNAGAWDPGSSADTIFKAQMAVGDDSAHPAFADTVASVDTTGYWRDFGPSDQGYHYNHNAETYMLVGDAAGRGMVELLSTGSTPGGFAGWLAGFDVGGQTGFDDDADGDGLENGIEAFFGTAPDSSNAGLAEIARSGNEVTFTHSEADPQLDDVTGSYEWSLDLATWNASGDTAGGVTATISASPDTPVTGTTTVTATFAGSVPDKVFVRVVANQN